MPIVLAFLLVVAASASPSLPASCLPLPAPAAAPVARGHGSRRAGNAEAQFVRACCARTLYPRLCYAGLAPYAASVHSSHARLALASANLTLAALDALAARIPPSPSPGFGGTLSDCAEAVASAEDQAARAAERLGGVEQAVGPELLSRVDDALTWLSAAMTYEETCDDGLGPRESAPAAVRAELRARVRRAKQFTSIALALVNILVTDKQFS